MAALVYPDAEARIDTFPVNVRHNVFGTHAACLLSESCLAYLSPRPVRQLEPCIAGNHTRRISNAAKQTFKRLFKNSRILNVHDAVAIPKELGHARIYRHRARALCPIPTASPKSLFTLQALHTYSLWYID